MKIRRIFFLLLTPFLLSAVTCRAAPEAIGIIKTVSGEVTLVSTQITLPALTNMKIVQGNTIKTGALSSVGMIFEDDTVVSLGPNSEMAVTNFLFNPVDRELSFVTRLVKGTFCFVTGQIAKLAPKNVTFDTPEAMLGVRGTKFLVKVD